MKRLRVSGHALQLKDYAGHCKCGWTVSDPKQVKVRELYRQHVLSVTQAPSSQQTLPLDSGETRASNLKKGDTITDGERIATIINNPYRPARKPGHITFDVRIEKTIHCVCVLESEPIKIIT